MRVLSVYLDTMFILGMVKEKPGYQDAFDILRKGIGSGNLEVVISNFALMESIDHYKEHECAMRLINEGNTFGDIRGSIGRERDLDENGLVAATGKISDWVRNNQVGLVQVDRPYTQVESLALFLSSKSPIMAPDSLHLSVALLAGCDVLLTDDTVFRTSLRKYLLSDGLQALVCDHLADTLGIERENKETLLNEHKQLIRPMTVKEFVAHFDRDPFPTAVPELVTAAV